MAAPFEDWYRSVPPVTRFYATGAVITTLACHIKVISPFDLYLNANLVWSQHQYWRLITNFFFLGTLNVDFLFHLFFFVRYSRDLEEGTFRNRTSDFVFMIMFGCTLMTLIAFAQVVNLMFLSHSLTFMLVYLWSKKNPNAPISFLGMFQFTAKWLPWALLLLTMTFNNTVPTTDLVGILVGGVYFYCAEVHPRRYNRVMLRTPRILKRLFDAPEDDFVAEPVAANPGGFGWGNGQPADEDAPLNMDAAQPAPQHDNNSDNED